MQNANRMSTWLWVFLVITAVALAGCLGPQPKPGEVFQCVADGKLEKNIAPEASLEAFTCVFNKFEGENNLHFNVTLKNVSSQPQRYKVNIFMDNGKAVGGLIPRKTKKGLVQPGQIASFTYPVPKMAKKPKAVMLNIRTMSK
jgi:hypothetical protein